MAYVDYKTYISSPAWEAKKTWWWQNSKWKKCYICSAPKKRNTQLHHRTYERLGDEWLSDLVAVCKPCHDLISYAWDIEKTKSRSKRRTLWEITDIARVEYRSHCRPELKWKKYRRKVRKRNGRTY